MTKAYKLEYIHPQKETFPETVVLIHGLFMFGWIMKPLAKRLARHGYRCILYDYPTCRKTIDSHGCDFADFLSGFVKENPDRKIHLVTHSLGGIVSRSALSKLESAERANIGRVVQIAPPNRGSDIARFAAKYVPFAGKISRVLPELSNAQDSVIHTVPLFEKINYGVIGAKFDLEVAESLYHLPDTTHYVSLPHSHTGILFGSETARKTLHFLSNGSFFQ